MPNLAHRSADIEIMDDLNCSGEVVHQTLRELETINTLLGGNYVTLNGIRVLLKKNSNRKEFTLADLGCGGGDILRLIRKWSDKHQHTPQLTGIDANAHIVAFAESATPPGMNIRYEAIDIFSEEFRQRKYDIVTGTLFFHHFTDDELIRFFRQLKTQVNFGFVVNDIHRHWFAFHSIKWLTAMLSKSAMVKFDAPLSVRRAFTKSELKNILEKAGIQNYTLRWMWAFRWQIVVFAGK